MWPPGVVERSGEVTGGMLVSGERSPKPGGMLKCCLGVTQNAAKRLLLLRIGRYQWGQMGACDALWTVGRWRGGVSFAVLAGTAAAAVGMDQLSKAVARNRLQSAPLRIGPGMWLVLVRNERGGLAGLPFFVAAALCLGASLALIVALLMAGPFATTTVVGLGCVMGGAAGNLVDRCWHGAVIDFIKLGWWPTFNLADTALCVGIALTTGSLL